MSQETDLVKKLQPAPSSATYSDRLKEAVREVNSLFELERTQRLRNSIKEAVGMAGGVATTALASHYVSILALPIGIAVSYFCGIKLAHRKEPSSKLDFETLNERTKIMLVEMEAGYQVRAEDILRQERLLLRDSKKPK